jgi:hypothetical protein
LPPCAADISKGRKDNAVASAAQRASQAQKAQEQQQKQADAELRAAAAAAAGPSSSMAAAGVQQGVSGMRLDDLDDLTADGPLPMAPPPGAVMGCLHGVTSVGVGKQACQHTPLQKYG